MSILLVFSFVGIWFYLGWLVLGYSKIEDGIMRGLLAPSVGMATVTLITTSASLAGLPIRQSIWIVISMLVGSLFVLHRTTWSGFKNILGANLFVAALNLCTAGIGLILFGMSWQGMINQDAATNSLAAQYFIAYPFFAEPNIQSIIAGTDYSPLSSMLFVTAGSRFGDVMLLGFSAALFSLNPDEVYMSHALAIRCALTAVSALLIYRRGASNWKLVITVILLTLSPLGIYTYGNQLISQMGGLALLLAAAMLFNVLLDQPHEFPRLVWPLAIVLAALCQSYPESVSLLALGIFLFGLYRAMDGELPPVRTIVNWAALLSLLVLLFLNVSLPNVLTHMLGALGSASNAQGSSALAGEFGYAFTPDLLPLLFGFVIMREGMAEPWALSLQVAALGLAGVAALFAARRFRRYPLLISFLSAALVAFLFLYWQGSGFGTFKMMLLMQVLIFSLLAALLIELIVARHLVGVFVSVGLLLLVGRAGVGYISMSMASFGSIPKLAQNNILDRIQGIIRTQAKDVVIESSSYLFGKFSVLRRKDQPTFFEQNSPESFASSSLKKLTSNRLETWRPDQNAFALSLFEVYDSNYKRELFQCKTPGMKIQFMTLDHKSDSSGKSVLVQGGKLMPLNRQKYDGIDVMLLDQANTKNFLAFRHSSVGGYDTGFGSVPSIFNLEGDLFVHNSMAGTGRYMLLELLSPSEDEVQLVVRYTRTYMAGQEAALPEITLYGAEAVKLGTSGAGSLNLTSPPLRPCTIDGRRYVLVDFGSEPRQFAKTAPWAYVFFNTPYVPDPRNLSGFLRDISTLNTNSKVSLNKFAALNDQWNFDAFESMFEYSGMFEDGWMSDHLRLRPRPELYGRNLNIVMDIPIEFANQNPLLSIVVDGTRVSRQALSAGRISVHISLPPGGENVIDLTTDKRLILPGGDGRSSIGLVRAITVE